MSLTYPTIWPTTYDYTRSYIDDTQPMEVFYVVGTSESYSLTDNGAIPFSTNFPYSCHIDYSLGVWGVNNS